MLDVVVIGSGYAGSVIAARLSPRARLLLVERGRWWKAGDFPTSILELGRAYRTTRNPSGLWGMRLGRGTGNAYASAFGGSSAVNYGITVRPDDHAFDGWPLSAAELSPYFERALAVLRPEPNPIGDSLGDKQFLDLVEPGRRVDIANTIDWERCTQCGRCVPGCNEDAKRSLDKSYLAVAMTAGAQVRLQTEVRSIAPHPAGGYRVELRRVGAGASASEWVEARHVVIAAGTLGTMDLMHKTSFALSPMFGRRLSMNGDGLAFLYNTSHQLSSHSGAPISTSVRLPFTTDDGRRRMLMVMSGRVPMAAMRFTGAALSAASGLLGRRVTGLESNGPRAQFWQRRLRDFLTVGERGALSHSFMYKLDGQDESRGQVRFSDSGAVIDWDKYEDQPVVRFAAKRLQAWADRVGGVLVPNIAQLPGMRTFSVHPLGGCRMGADIGSGVVDHVGRVFNPQGGVYDGLRIADGSIFAGSLGVPPSLTIAALAERIADSMERELAAS